MAAKEVDSALAAAGPGALPGQSRYAAGAFASDLPFALRAVPTRSGESQSCFEPRCRADACRQA